MASEISFALGEITLGVAFVEPEEEPSKGSLTPCFNKTSINALAVDWAKVSLQHTTGAVVQFEATYVTLFMINAVSLVGSLHPGFELRLGVNSGLV